MQLLLYGITAFKLFPTSEYYWMDFHKGMHYWHEVCVMEETDSMMLIILYVHVVYSPTMHLPICTVWSSSLNLGMAGPGPSKWPRHLLPLHEGISHCYHGDRWSKHHGDNIDVQSVFREADVCLLPNGPVLKCSWIDVSCLLSNGPVLNCSWTDVST